MTTSAAQKLTALPAIVLMAALLPFSQAAGQSYKDSTFRKNIIKYDISSGVFYNNAYIFKYERLVKQNQSASLIFGVEQLPTLVSIFENEESEMTSSRKTASGFKLGFDYRFYLSKENRYKGGHGVYIGPYTALHDLKNSWNITLNGNSGTQSGTLSSKIQVINIGFQAGYQFLINNRWCVDMTFIGASLSHYRARMDVKGNLDRDDIEINQALLDKLVEKFPLLGDLVEDGTVDQAGKLDNWGLGVRYMVNVGYAFGGSSKKAVVKTP